KLLLNPVSMTVPLIDPNRFLSWLSRWTAALPSWLWWGGGLALILAALSILPTHWAALTARGLEGFLDLENILLIGCIYPVVKTFHELGHGLATRARGGEVHEMGLMFIAFFPIPYVEASASLSFRSKWDRAAVAGAGVMVEMCIAAAAFLLWIGAEPGMFRVVLFNTMLISGFSTLAVNGNPLLKFDGYHVLCDLIEIPNLAQRGNQWWAGVLRVHLLGTRERRRARMPTVAWERLWFIVYPPAAFIYRILISLKIALFVATTYRLIGGMLAIWSLSQSLVWPAFKTAKAALTDGRIRQAGGRAWQGAGLAVVALMVFFLAVPLPHRAVVQGVTWLPEEAFLRAPQAGRIVEFTAEHGAIVHTGTALAVIDAPELSAKRAVARARLAQTRAQYDQAQVKDRAKAVQLRATMRDLQRQVTEAERQVAELQLSASIDGRLDLPRRVTPVGQYRDRGEVIGYVLPDAAPVVRVAVPQGLVELVRGETAAVEVRFADEVGKIYAAHILRVVPSGKDHLPSEVLALDGGGMFATAPAADGGQRSITRIFVLDLVLDQQTRPVWGLRVFVRLSFAPKPLAVRLARTVREVFINAFGV
ncbi:HlyD family efflux transporter periplasmic adaptor subunit, partial [Pseudorhodobacter sp.]|uniref:biotin/lipoyl-binding protein n=1 Tax=Pseudorhodobacter sp. TaxID=1934400 RepID=UPI0026493A5E